MDKNASTLSGGNPNSHSRKISSNSAAGNKQNNVVAGPDLNIFYRLDPLSLKFCADRKDWSHAKLIAGLI